MKKIISALMSAVMIAGTVPTIAAKETKGVNTVIKTIYVSPTGSDSAAGTVSAPLKTLGAAKEAANRLNDGSADIEVALSGGEYRLTDTLTFSADDGGKNGHSVTWRGREGENPIVSGFTYITGWELYDSGKNIYRAPVP